MVRALALLAPADAARRALLLAFGPLARPLLVDRERRVAFGFTFVVLGAVVMASFEPILLLALGPIFLGVPHVFADLRYLVAQPGLHRRPLVWLFVVAPLVGLTITADPRYGFAAMVGAGLIARGGLARRAAIVGAGLLLVLAAHLYRWPMLLGFAHIHNLVAVAAFWVWRRRRRRLAAIPLALFAACSAFVLLGGYGPIAAYSGGLEASSSAVALDEQIAILAPAGAGAWGGHLVVFFAFAQAVHYGLWLRVIPDEARPGKTTRSFKQTARALVADLSLPIVAVAFVLSAGLVVYALVDLREARLDYFRFAMFHGYLELAAFALFFAEGSVERAKEQGFAARVC